MEGKAMILSKKERVSMMLPLATTVKKADEVLRNEGYKTLEEKMGILIDLNIADKDDPITKRTYRNRLKKMISSNRKWEKKMISSKRCLLK